MAIIEEIYKPIKGYEGKYYVSNLGNVKNNKNLILKYQLNHGYRRYTLWKNNKSKLHFGHKLVMENFKPTLNTNLQVNHINGNKLDNRLENLEWVSPSENLIHAWKNNLVPEKSKQKIINNNLLPRKNRKVGMYDIKNLKLIKVFSSIKEASEYINSPVSASSIIKVCRGKEKSCKGYLWKYQ